MARRVVKKRGKATPATWMILVLILVAICLSAISCNTISKSNEQKKTIAKLENKVEKLAPMESEALSYQKLFPEMKVDKAKEWKKDKKVVYLTFDDGPTKKNTLPILKILKQENVKATFFVIGKGTDHDIMKNIVDDGHAIGVHTYKHNYREIYETIDTYVEDFNNIFTLIKEKTGVTPTIYRYPGGSNNVFNTLNQEETTAEMFRRGFVPFDWNVDSTDASENTRNASAIKDNALMGIGQDRAIVLMHDSLTKTTTVDALPAIIKGYKKAGYKFEVLTNEVSPVLFSTPDGKRYD